MAEQDRAQPQNLVKRFNRNMLIAHDLLNNRMRRRIAAVRNDSFYIIRHLVRDERHRSRSHRNAAEDDLHVAAVALPCIADPGHHIPALLYTQRQLLALAVSMRTLIRKNHIESFIAKHTENAGAVPQRRALIAVKINTGAALACS